MPREIQRLSRKHKLFCFHYATSFNAAESALKAGFKESNRYNYPYILMKSPLIKSELARLFKENEISDDELKQKIQKFIDVADSDTNRLRAAELMAKVKGIVKGSETNVAVSVGGEKTIESIMSRRFAGLAEAAPGE